MTQVFSAKSLAELVTTVGMQTVTGGHFKRSQAVLKVENQVIF